MDKTFTISKFCQFTLMRFDSIRRRTKFYLCFLLTTVHCWDTDYPLLYFGDNLTSKKSRNLIIIVTWSYLKLGKGIGKYRCWYNVLRYLTIKKIKFYVFLPKQGCWARLSVAHQSNIVMHTCANDIEFVTLIEFWSNAWYRFFMCVKIKRFLITNSV